ncbi:PPOX class F420-dependent oxidoreductase [Nocardia callitridis]
MELSTAVAFARAHRWSVLTTIRRDGRPQLSNVLHVIGDDGIIRVSITADRAKYHNLRRVPWAAVHVSSDDFADYTVIEGEVELTPVASAPDDPGVDALVDYYRAGAGEHPDWAEYRAAMVADRRVLAVITPTYAYGRS